MELDIDTKEELLKIIDKASTGRVDLSSREAAMLFHWVRHINDEMYAWVPDKYKVIMPQYNGGND